MSHRRKQILAGAAVVVVVVVAIVLVGTLGGGASTDTATDRAQIAAVALAYSQAIEGSTDPCRYLDSQSRAFVMAQARRDVLAAGRCEPVVESLSGTPPVEGVDPARIVFGSASQRVDCSGFGYGLPHGLPASQRGLPWATAAWPGGSSAQVTFVREDGRWWVDVLICPGAGS